MKKLMVFVMALSAVFGIGLRAQDVTGQWQGTLAAGKGVRLVARIAKADKGWAATLYNVDQAGQTLKTTSGSLDGSTFKFSIDMMSITYEGKLSADGKSLTGTWTEGSESHPLVLARTTPETAWEIPEPPKPPTLMAADANPSFDVATIKPSQSAESSIQQLTMNGRNFRIRNGSLGDLIGFAYDVQMKQIVNSPDWMDKDRYDVDGVPDKEGAPSPQQLRIMMQKLLADRFALKLHKEKRDLPAFVLAVGKNGPKLTPTQLNGPLPGFGMRPGSGGLALHVMNSTMDEFTSFMQMLVLDHPVVNQTALNGRFDFNVTFTPDDSQFKGHPPKVPQGADAVESAPSLFDAMQQQTGLKLSAEKTAVDVIAVDHVEKPSAN